MIVGDVALSVGINRVIGGIRVQAHVAVELLMPTRLGAAVRLGQRLNWFLHQFNAHPFVAFGPYDRTMVAVVNGKLAL